jgi:SulP family sulfate permease
MSGSPVHRATLLGGELFAGLATAMIFYAEYVGLGSQLGSVWLGQGVGNLGYGNVLSFAAGVVACMLALLVPGAHVPGPRAASVVVLMSSLLYLSSRFGLDLKAQSAAAAIALLAAAGTLLACSGGATRNALASLPAALMHAFNFATAVFIVSDGVARAVIDCQQVDAVLAWTVFGGVVVFGALWGPVCEISAAVLRWPLLARLTPLGTMVAVGLAWCVYEHSALSHGDGFACGRFGTQALRVGVLIERTGSVWQTVGELPLAVWLGAIACGLGTGIALLLESSSAFVASDGALLPSQARRLRVTALANGIGACAGVGPISYSAARTQAMRLFGGRTRLSVLTHGVAIVVLALLAGPWMGHIPQFAIGVVLALVGLNMVTPGMCRMWREAYAPRAPHFLVHGVAGFWLSVVSALALGSALAGFLIGLAAYAWWNFARSLREG